MAPFERKISLVQFYKVILCYQSQAKDWNNRNLLTFDGCFSFWVCERNLEGRLSIVIKPLHSSSFPSFCSLHRVYGGFLWSTELGWSPKTVSRDEFWPSRNSQSKSIASAPKQSHNTIRGPNSNPVSKRLRNVFVGFGAFQKCGKINLVKDILEVISKIANNLLLDATLYVELIFKWYCSSLGTTSWMYTACIARDWLKVV